MSLEFSVESQKKTATMKTYALEEAGEVLLLGDEMAELFGPYPADEHIYAMVWPSGDQDGELLPLPAA